jgi:hypothetical protein
MASRRDTPLVRKVEPSRRIEEVSEIFGPEQRDFFGALGKGLKRPDRG